MMLCAILMMLWSYFGAIESPGVLTPPKPGFSKGQVALLIES